MRTQIEEKLFVMLSKLSLSRSTTIILFSRHASFVCDRATECAHLISTIRMLAGVATEMEMHAFRRIAIKNVMHIACQLVSQFTKHVSCLLIDSPHTAVHSHVEIIEKRERKKYKYNCSMRKRLPFIKKINKHRILLISLSLGILQGNHRTLKVEMVIWLWLLWVLPIAVSFMLLVGSSHAGDLFGVCSVAKMPILNPCECTDIYFGIIQHLKMGFELMMMGSVCTNRLRVFPREINVIT